MCVRLQTRRGGVPLDGPDSKLLFRHADGDVLMQVVPTMTAPQFVRLLGPATRLIFACPRFAANHGDSVRVVERPPAVVASAGMLRLTHEQIGSIDDRRLHASRRETVAYLREYAAEDVEDMNDAALWQEVKRIEAVGFELELDDLTAHMKLAYLSVSTGGALLEDDVFLTEVRASDDPNEAVDRVMDGFIDYLDEEEV